MTKNFSLNEFNCRDKNNTPVPENLMPNLWLLVENLQTLRDEIGEPIHINSGYRTKAHNKAVGGEKNSFHLKAMAADITVKNKTPKQVKTIIEKLIKNGSMLQGGIGLYNGFVHYDVRSHKARW